MRPKKREARVLEDQMKGDEDPLEEENRVIRLMDEPTPERKYEEEEQRFGEEKDVIKLPEGMKGVVRGEDQDIEKEGEGVESGGEG